MLDKKQSIGSLDSAISVFNIFVLIVGAIALTLAFFLLLISTTSNIRDNVWEYGCLRAIGLTKAQGLSCFMYEQYAVILSALFLGSGVGLVLACMVTAQFFLFIELPFELTFPWTLLLTMVCMALVTTYLAVRIPVS